MMARGIAGVELDGPFIFFLRAREIPIVSMQDPAKCCVAVGKAVIEFDRLEGGRSGSL